MPTMTDQRAQVAVTLNGTPEQIRSAYRQILDSLDDLTDLNPQDTPTWACYMTFDLDEDWRRPADPAKVQAYLMADLDGQIPRNEDASHSTGGVWTHGPLNPWTPGPQKET